jgi:hypothetical protein
MDRGQSLVTDLQSPRLPDPRQRPFHHPTDRAQPAPMRRTLPRQVVLDPSPLEPLPVARGPVLPVAVQRVGPTAATATRLSDRRNRVEQRHRQERLVPLGTRDLHRQGGAVAVYEEMAFRAFFRPIRGVWAGEDPPKTARYVWLSTTAFDQSRRPSRPRRSSKAVKSFFQTPRRCQYRSRRQQVTPEPQPISWGNIHHGIPLWRTKMIPVRQARSPTGGRPRLPGLALCRGRRGSMISHNSSGTKGRAIAHLQSAALGHWNCTARYF